MIPSDIFEKEFKLQLGIGEKKAKALALCASQVSKLWFEHEDVVCTCPKPKTIQSVYPLPAICASCHKHVVKT